MRRLKMQSAPGARLQLDDMKRFDVGMRKACRAAGVPPSTFHSLRHTYGTLSVKAGVPLAVIAERMGHADVTMILRLYGQVTKAMRDRATEAIAAAF
jgi:integrase